MADRRKTLTLIGIGLLGAGGYLWLQGQPKAAGSSGSTASGAFPFPDSRLPAFVNPQSSGAGDISQVWMIGKDHKKHGVPDFSTFQNCHFSKWWVTAIDPAVLATIPQGADVSAANAPNSCYF